MCGFTTQTEVFFSNSQKMIPPFPILSFPTYNGGWFGVRGNTKRKPKKKLKNYYVFSTHEL
jgi:hypothetical protein